MDYIQQAIDKARDERQGNVGVNKGARVEAPAQPVDNKHLTQGVPDEISYTETRQINLDDENLREHRIIAGFNHDKRAEPYRQLRTQVIQKLRKNDWNTLAVTGPNDNAGKTLTAVNLAVSLSKETNQTVMLVDLDLRGPSIMGVLDVEVKYGLVDHLKQGVPVRDILINPGLERLVILPGKADPDYSSEILSSRGMKSLLNELTGRYKSRIIIFDLPSLLTSDDALAFIPYVDAALLVVEDGVTTAEQVERSLRMLEGTNLLGTILNKAGQS